MKKMFLFILLLSISVNASITEKDDYFNAFCSAEDSVGFNWKNSRWSFTKFYLNKYIIQKLKVEKLVIGNSEITKSGYCWNEMQNLGEPMAYGDKQYTYGCYNIRREGTDFYPLGSEKCMETWEKSGEDYKLIIVDCKDFKFNPNGWFHHSKINNDVENYPKDDYKDSLSVDYGKCSEL